MQRITSVVHQAVKPLAPPTLQGLADIANEIIERTGVAGVKADCGCFLSQRFDFVK
jgi:hypothetical protein